MQTVAVACDRLRATATALAGLLALLFLLSACTIRLAPEHDQAIVDGLAETNQQAMTLFASVADGGDAAGFAEREARYGQVIGRFEALRVEAEARPVPDSAAAGLFGLGGSEASDADSIELLETPTPSVLAQIVALLERMRQTDQAGELTRAKVVGFKNSYETGIAQALVYEKALAR